MSDTTPEKVVEKVAATGKVAHPFVWYRQATPGVRRTFWTCWAAWSLDSMDGLVYQYLAPVLLIGLGMTQVESNWIVSANYFASAIGGWAGGWLADRFGRARMLVVTILWFSAFSLLSGFAQSFEQLLVIRALQGLGFGAEWAVGAVLLGEMIAREHRGKALGVVQSGAPIGSALAALLAGPVVALFPDDLGWRIVFWAGALPALLVFFVRRGADDSPLYVAARARAKEKKRTVTPFAIFHPRYLRLTIPAALLALGVQGAAFSMGNYATRFLQTERGLSIEAAGYFVFALSAGGILGCVVNAMLSDRLGRATIFRLFAGGFLAAASFYLLAPLGNSVFTLLPAGALYGFFQFGIYASFGPFFTELFPTEVRGNGQAFAYNFGRANAFFFIQGVLVVTSLFGLVLSQGMLIMAATGVVLTLVATLLLPETAGRDLAELDRRAEERSNETPA